MSRNTHPKWAAINELDLRQEDRLWHPDFTADASGEGCNLERKCVRIEPKIENTRVEYMRINEYAAQNSTSVGNK